MRPILLSLTWLFFLAACGGGTNTGVRPEGQAELGEYSISWRQMRSDSGPREATPLFFVFGWNDAVKAKLGYAKEADFEREAKILGVSVQLVKSLNGREAYVNRNGRVAQCTYIAIQNGLCGKRLNLSVSQRAALARKALEQHDRCRWIGFDPAYNAQRSVAGAQDATLWVKADCR
ncbi:hypothetical protein PVW46_18975 [Mameliella sp. AT18]|uniref:hypothetical protein n=1 Tax=Mameliella sp. AT18 TaxID=3028385 RepID=UPI000840FE78|nr:hypothetical protein [Mameliella sp. AT18]MDD9731994.1 hypothetical protein [Mameliella sp. AT18]ODM48640.1 hypothetical protein A9320_02870 [Ruegeria sp. PBVC088]